MISEEFWRVFVIIRYPAKSVPWGRFLALPLSSTRLVDFWNISDNISIYVFFLSTVKQGVSGDQIHLHLNSLHFCQIYQNFFMILLFLFSHPFWTNALFHNRVLSIRSDPFQELHFGFLPIIKSVPRKGQNTPKSDFRGPKIPPRGAS